jgi:glutamine amidotransferase PdxT
MPAKNRRPLDLTTRLARPIVLTGGPRTRLETLQDAATLIRDLDRFRQARPVWDRAAEMILLAGTTKKRADVAEATRQLLVALGHENWWKPGTGPHRE